MNSVAIKRKRNNMHDNDLVNLFIVIKGAVVTAFVFTADKIFGFVLSVPVVTTYISPDVREFLIELSPFIGITVGLLTIVSLIYKIKISHKSLKDKI